MDFQRVAQPTKKTCNLCRRDEYVPKPEDVPMALRHMKMQILQALRPLDIDSGKFQRAQYGYRVLSSMMTFAWAGASSARASIPHEFCRE